MHHSPKSDPTRRSRLLSRILDPEYSGATPGLYAGSLRARSPSLADLPQPSVFVDQWGQQHDPDFRPFGSYPILTPADDHDQSESWPWSAEQPSLSSARRSSTTVSSSYHSSSSGSRSRSISVLPSPTFSPPEEKDQRDITRPRISPPGEIPRSALFPWTPAQRAVRVQHEIAKRNILPPPSLPEEDDPEQEIPLSLVDSRYVPGYGHSPPAHIQLSSAPIVPSGSTSPSKDKKNGRVRAHTVPVPTAVRRGTEEPEDSEAPVPQSPSCTHSLRQSVYSLGLKTKLGLYHMKVRVRKASSAARRPLSL